MAAAASVVARDCLAVCCSDGSALVTAASAMPKGPARLPIAYKRRRVISRMTRLELRPLDAQENLSPLCLTYSRDALFTLYRRQKTISRRNSSNVVGHIAAHLLAQVPGPLVRSMSNGAITVSELQTPLEPMPQPSVRSTKSYSAPVMLLSPPPSPTLAPHQSATTRTPMAELSQVLNDMPFVCQTTCTSVPLTRSVSLSLSSTQLPLINDCGIQTPHSSKNRPQQRLTRTQSFVAKQSRRSLQRL